ncbi:MAG TPA: 2-oxoacid:acceptor oxidoreductase family protein [Candidatus Hydrogenedentes bacterium]|nr:2-oxoacid:acceptor oxidoreductase family protein [Candidatus Hydrogenedentota bacterium]HRT18521.1 2-oxoacid:acceptor oxidoreductase family protein [Candidatus Hydrogenedentota bacterium]HRT63540.1 2-oxoacid:acceptor oxidoreductase family protein [Candidatus Hydrogenedentota bacterium]
MKEEKAKVKYPGIRDAMDGNTAVIMCERESTDAAGAYPITPSTQMGEYWAQETAKGHVNVSGRPLIFVEPEGEHAAAAVTAGMSMTGLRAANFSSGQGIAYMHESLYCDVGKRLTYILNIGCRAITKHSLNVHAGHDDYHCIDDTGMFQVFGKSAQETCDLNIIAHKIAELSLNPGAVGQDGFLTTHLIESLMVPERELIAEYLGSPEDIIDTPTPAQRLMFGDKRRRIPELWDVDNPVMAGVVQNQDSYMQGVAAQRPFFFDHIAEIADQCFDEFHALTGRRYYRVTPYAIDDADYLIIAQGSVVSSAEVVADYLRETRGLKIGVLNMTMFRPFPADLIGKYIKGRKGIVLLERTDQPLSVELPLAREVRATISKCLENGAAGKGAKPYPNLASFAAKDVPPLYSGCFGMGSRDLQAEGIIGAIENMLPDGPKKKFFYLGIDFIRDNPFSEQQAEYQKQILAGYPNVKELAVHGSENPNLMPKGAITVRFHSIGGWGAITTGKNLAVTLFELLNYHIKANPKYGSEKKGQPTTYYLSAAPEPIRINCEYFYVDVVLSPDPNVFSHSNPLAGLKKGGVFVIQSDLPTPDDVWGRIPPRFQKIIVDNDIRVFYLDAFKIAREEASDPELQFRMQGNAFQGAFFAASPVMENNKLDEETLFKAITDQLQHKFGAKGARIVEDNVRVVRRGYMEVKEIKNKVVGKSTVADPPLIAEPPLPLRIQPSSLEPNTNLQRFWEQTGNFYLTGKGGDNLADPFIGLSCMPALSGLIRDMTQIRFEHPEWDAEKCIGCAACWTVCPDSALPGLVNTIDEIFETTTKRLANAGHEPVHLRSFLKQVEPAFRALIAAGKERDSVMAALDKALADTFAACTLPEADKAALAKEIALFQAEIGCFKWSNVKPYFKVKEKRSPGSGGLLSITVNPYACKGCMECVRVCPEYALRPVTQTPETIEKMRKAWEYWLSLPTTRPEYMLFEDLNAGIGALETLLLDKKNYTAMTGGDGACVGCGEKTALHLFTATVEALMQPRIAAHVAKIDELTTRLEAHIREKLAHMMDTADTPAFEQAMQSLEGKDLTLANLQAALAAANIEHPIDSAWLARVTKTLAKLKHLKWCYTSGVSTTGRARMGMVNSTGCTSVWGSTWPFNPYPFPWTNHLFQDSSSVAIGIFEGHMVKMAEGFKALRIAELEIEDQYDPKTHDAFFTYFNWRNFSDEEFLLCPPVVAVGGDGAMFDIGFQNVSRALMTGKPIRIFIVDTQVYSNTGGQACTSGWTGQISDMAEYGKAFQGKEEIRKEMGLIAMAHRTSYVMNGSISNPSHLIEGFIRGLNARRPAIFTVYTPCMPEHGIADDIGRQQAKLAVEGRAFPLYRFNPDKGTTFAECIELDGNPAIKQKWPTYTLNYVDADKKPAKMTLPMTFADFAVTEGRFRKQFKKAPASTWNENMVPIADFLDLSPEDRKGKFPFVWVVNKDHTLGRLIVAEPLVKACEERLMFWTQLKALAEVDKETIDVEKIASDARAQARAEIMNNLTANLLALAGDEPTKGKNMKVTPANELKAPADCGCGCGGFTPATIDSEDCTACGECIEVNPKIFGWNDEKLATVIDPKGGPFKDIVKAAEKCPARVIHPGTPADPGEADLDALIARAQKYN